MRGKRRGRWRGPRMGLGWVGVGGCWAGLFGCGVFWDQLLEGWFYEKASPWHGLLDGRRGTFPEAWTPPTIGTPAVT